MTVQCVVKICADTDNKFVSNKFVSQLEDLIPISFITEGDRATCDLQCKLTEAQNMHAHRNKL